MSKTNENKLVPKLRFPEFENSNEWEETTLGKITNITNGKSNAQDHIENGKYPLFDRSAIIKASNNFLFDCEAVIIPGEGMKFIPKYYKGKFDLHQRAYALKDFAVEVEGIFVYYLMMHRSDLLAKKAVKSTVLSLRLPILQNFPIQIPKVLKEQQKIAVCLSSLDEVITAESQKLDLLKEHKKGLLQNLFPQEGKTVPKLRFKEFEDGGEWEETTLTQVADYKNGKAHEQDIDDSGDFIVVNSKFISSDGEVKKSTNIAFCPAQKGDILMVLSDIPNGKAIAKCFLVEEEDRYTVNQRVCKITPRNLNSKILYYLLNRNPYFLAFDDGVKQTNLRKEDVLNCPLMMPEDHREQKKIAETLSSIDDLINAQSQKIEALKLHKKGLLQGLFPDINEENPSNSMEVENDRN